MIQKSLFTLLLMAMATHNATPSSASAEYKEEEEVRDPRPPANIIANNIPAKISRIQQIIQDELNTQSFGLFLKKER